jgi:hypothetical protein
MLAAAEPLVRVSVDTRNRIVFSAGGKVFTAEAAARADAVGAMEYELVPSPGDEVSLVIDRSAISWPTALQLNFMTGTPAVGGVTCMKAGDGLAL